MPSPSGDRLQEQQITHGLMVKAFVDNRPLTVPEAWLAHHPAGTPLPERWCCTAKSP
jgi:hypothetical protein